MIASRGELALVAFALALLLAVLSPGAVRAQETREHEFPSLEEEVGFNWRRLPVQITLANRFVGSADFGTFSASQLQPEGRLRIFLPVTDRLVFRFLGTGRVLIYDFDGNTNIDGGDPFANLNSWTFRLQAAWMAPESWALFSQNERWLFLGEIFNKARWESGASLSDSLENGGTLAVGYRLGDRLELALGFSVQSRLDGGIRVGPVLEATWKINERWKLKTYGIGLQVERMFGENFSLFVRTRLEGRNFRVDNRGGEFGGTRGTFQVRQLPTGVGFRWRIKRAVRVTAVAGVMAYQRMRALNRYRETVGEVTASPAPYLSVRFDIPQ